MKQLIALSLFLCVFLCGCGTWLDGNYHSVTPHKENSNQSDPENMSASDYADLQNALERMVLNYTESGIITVNQYKSNQLAQDVEQAILYMQQTNPLGAYAIGEIHYELGTTAGLPAVAVNITYLHSRTDIQKIKTYSSIDSVKAAIGSALDECATEVVLYINDYSDMDYVQWVDDYGALHPDMVMEIPEITVSFYPDTGVDRIVELRFSYQTSREALRAMQNKVAPVFEAAELYISDDAEAAQKYAQLYSFLMERFDYQIQTSITPAYSLISHGVGNPEAFANVYAAMCRRVGLECHTVSGTCKGEAWFWNLIFVNDGYYHLDLLHCSQSGAFQMRSNDEMGDYVWDYSAYPALHTG